MSCEIDKNGCEAALIRAAQSTAANAYTPYSHFNVGAALLAKSGEIYVGCNVENATYGATNCAERTAIFSAVAAGEQDFSAVAIFADSDIFPYPCGICLQVMSEFCSPDFEIIVANKTGIVHKKLSELLPNAFVLS